MFEYNLEIDKKKNQKDTINIDRQSRAFEILKKCNRIWNEKKEKEAIKKICISLNTPIHYYEFKYYIITCPKAGFNYKKNRIYISIHTRHLQETILEEIHHIYFLKTYLKTLKIYFTDKDIWKIQEAFIFTIGLKTTYPELKKLQSFFEKIFQSRLT